MSEWLPIITAPKDTWVLVCDVDRGKFAVWRNHKITERNGYPVYMDDVSGMGGYECEVDISPTHWQPLPEPPST